MNNNKTIALCLALTLVSQQALAYQESTHEKLNKHAVLRSVLATDATLLSDLGLLPFNQAGYATNQATSQGRTNLTATELISFGGKYEDADYRSLNHFYDPQYNRPYGRGLQVVPVSMLIGGVANPDWALEDRGDVNPGDPACGSINDCTQNFSFKKGQQALYDSLVSITPGARLQAASRALQSLGQVTHLLQDMGQPQHTRNDQHLHPVPLIGTNPSWSFYEMWTQSQDAKIDAMLQAQLGTASAYPVPRFATARSYWHSADMTTANYVGMAEFTSQNYTSYGTQYVAGQLDRNYIGAAPGIVLPDGTGRSIVRLPTQGFVTPSGTTVAPGYADFIVGSIRDDFTNQPVTGVKLASKSVMWTFLLGMPKQVFVENTEVYRDHHKVLLPRAVAFSAGLINHFFRGRLDMVPEPGRTNFWRITNTGKDAMDGTFSVYAEDEYGTRDQIQTSMFHLILAPGSIAITGFTPPANAKKLVAVFIGKIGADSGANGEFNAVAGKVISYAVPPEFSFTRSPTPMVAGKSFRLDYTTKNATSGTYVCNATKTGGMSAAGTLTMGTGVITGTAQSAWVDAPSTCTYTLTGPAGSFAFNESNIKTDPAPVPAVPCGQVIRSGSSSGLDVVQELGTTPGKVSVNFEAFSIPDGLEIKADNPAATLLATTGGLVAGTKALSFTHDPTARGTTRVRVKVTGNSDTGTVWNVGVSCPGQAAPGSTAVTVKFVIEGPSQPSDCWITYSLTVDGISRPFPYNLPMSPGENHTYTLIAKNASLDSSCTWYKVPYYYDNNGQHRMWTGQPIGFQVQ